MPAHVPARAAPPSRGTRALRNPTVLDTTQARQTRRSNGTRPVREGAAGGHTVVEVDVGHVDRLWQRGGVHRKVVVLRRDLDLAGAHVPDGVVASMVAKGQFERLGAKRLTEDLVAHADAKDGLLSEDRLCVLHRVRRGGGVALCRGAFG